MQPVYIQKSRYTSTGPTDNQNVAPHLYRPKQEPQMILHNCPSGPGRQARDPSTNTPVEVLPVGECVTQQI